MTRIRGVHHVQITVPVGAEDEAGDFYCRVLGLREAPKPESLADRGGFWLDCGDRQVPASTKAHVVHVGVEDGVDRTASKAHVAYEVTDLAGWRERLADEGIEAIDGVPIPGYERFELRDPFGNRVELIERVSGA